MFWQTVQGICLSLSKRVRCLHSMPCNYIWMASFCGIALGAKRFTAAVKTIRDRICRRVIRFQTGLSSGSDLYGAEKRSWDWEILVPDGIRMMDRGWVFFGPSVRILAPLLGPVTQLCSPDCLHAKTEPYSPSPKMSTGFMIQILIVVFSFPSRKYMRIMRTQCTSASNLVNNPHHLQAHTPCNFLTPRVLLPLPMQARTARVRSEKHGL